MDNNEHRSMVTYFKANLKNSTNSNGRWVHGTDGQRLKWINTNIVYLNNSTWLDGQQRATAQISHIVQIDQLLHKAMGNGFMMPMDNDYS